MKQRKYPVMPRKLRSSTLLVGCGQFWIALVDAGDGLMPSAESWRPRNSIVSTPYCDLCSMISKLCSFSVDLDSVNVFVVLLLGRCKRQNVIKVDYNVAAGFQCSWTTS